MKKENLTNLILGGLVVVLLITNVTAIGGLLWQQSQIEKLRQQLAVAPAASQEIVTATNVCTAAQNGNLPRLMKLLDQHPELLNTPSGPGRATPLHHAVYNRRVPVMEELLRRNADVNALNGNGATPLHDCASKGTVEMAQTLLDHGAKINVRSYARLTPLGLALSRERADMAEFLRQQGGQE